MKLYLEALLFAADRAVTVPEIKVSLQEAVGLNIEELEIENMLGEICQRYASPDYSFELAEKGGGFQFLTKPQYHPVILAFIKQKSAKTLSAAALETLAIIAYKQPVTKTEIEQIRGVNSEHTVQKLLEKELIVMQGRSEEPGRPILFGTSKFFMDYFGINSLQDLPKLKEIQPKENEIGQDDKKE